MRAIIFANGIFKNPLRGPVPQPEDLVIAADGGSRHCLDLQITPDVLIGDLDSTEPALIEKWTATGVEVIQHPEDKDQTDLELAILLAQERDADEILVYGAVGGRLDMTFGNLTLLAHPDLHTPTALICGNEEVHLMRPGEKLSLDGNPGEILSLIPLQPDYATISARGVEYPLVNEKLSFGTTRGISNRLVDNQAEIQLESGQLAVIHTRQEAYHKED